MGVVNKGIYERMALDTQLVNLLATYNGEPAIFLIHPIPTDVDYPFVTAFEDISLGEPFDSKNSLGRVVNRQVRAYTRNTGSIVFMDDIVERLRFLFHRQHDNISIDGYRVIIANVFGPRQLPTDERIYGVELQVNLTIEQI